MRWLLPLITLFLLAAAAPGAEATIQTNRWYVTPHFGLSASDNSGVLFGMTSSFMLTPHLGVGPFGEFSTAGRQWESEIGGAPRKTEASKTWMAGVRMSYHLHHQSDAPWRLHAGVAWLRLTAIDEYRDGGRLALFDPARQRTEDGIIETANRVAGFVGIGTFLPMNDRTRIALDLQVFGAPSGDRTAVTASGSRVALEDFAGGGGFWMTTITLGFHVGR